MTTISTIHPMSMRCPSSETPAQGKSYNNGTTRSTTMTTALRIMAKGSAPNVMVTSIRYRLVPAPFIINHAFCVRYSAVFIAVWGSCEARKPQTSMQAHVRGRIACMWACAHAHGNAHAHVHAHVHVRAHAHVHTHACAHVHTCTCLQKCVAMRACAFQCTCVCAWNVRTYIKVINYGRCLNMHLCLSVYSCAKQKLHMCCSRCMMASPESVMHLVPNIIAAGPNVNGF